MSFCVYRYFILFYYYLFLFILLILTYSRYFYYLFNFIVWIYQSLFTHLPADACLRCFQFLIFIHKAAVDIYVQTFV